MGYAFIIYSSKDLEYVNALRKAFADYGIETWMAPGDIPVGSTYSGVILRAIKGADCLVLMLTNHSQTSIWVDKEVEKALANGKTIVPIALENIKLNDNFEFYLGNQQIVPVRQLSDNNEELVAIINRVRSLTKTDKGHSNLSDPAIQDETDEVSTYLTKAKNGDVDAQYKLASMYSRGRDGLSKDKDKAFFWYTKAAESGHALAQYSLAWAYKRGEGIKENPKKAFFWFEEAANGGNIYAISNVGTCYRTGYGVEKDSSKAVEWLRRADFSSVCCMQLGELYELGEGVEKDLLKALSYYEKAEILGGVGEQPKRGIKRIKGKIRNQ